MCRNRQIPYNRFFSDYVKISFTRAGIIAGQFFLRLRGTFWPVEQVLLFRSGLFREQLGRNLFTGSLVQHKLLIRNQAIRNICLIFGLTG